MSIECVIDSSSIISLCKCGLEAYLQKSGWGFISVKEVFTETVETGSAMGFGDALVAKKLFDEGVITVAEIKGGLPAGFTTDERVIELALQRKARLLSNDPKLARKASVKGLTAIRSAGLCRLLYECRWLGRSDFRNAVMLLVEKKRLSEKSAEIYLEEVS